MKHFYIQLILVFFISIPLFAQDTAAPATQSTANCTQILRLARAVYEQGRLHELQNLLEDCIAKPTGLVGNFTVQEKVDALRLLCLSYIYLEEPEKADNAMLRLLQTDHFFEVNPTDPAEFKALHRTFRTDPIFNWGVRIGGNVNMFHIQKVYSVASGSAGNGQYGLGASFVAGVFIEREFFPKHRDESFLKNTLVRFEAFYVARSNKITYDNLWLNQTDTNLPAATAETKIANNWIDLNLIARYKYFRNSSSWNPYIGIGGGTSILMGSKLNISKFEWKEKNDNTVSPGSSYSGPSVDVKSAYIKFPLSAAIVWGVNRRFGGLYFNGEARYQYEFNNLINDKKRTIPDMTQYAMTFNDFNQSTFILSVGVSVPKFSPKKLSLKK